MSAVPATAKVHPKHDWLAATPDMLAMPAGEKEWDRVGEIKCPRYGDDWGTTGTDEVPDYHVAQAALEMAVYDLPLNDVVAFIHGGIRVYPLRRDPELEGLLVERAHKFWVDHVLADLPPPPDGSDQCDEYLRRRFAEHSANMLSADAEAERFAADIKRARALIAEAESLEAKAKQQLMVLIGEHAGIAAPDWKITWKKSKDSKRVDWEAVAKAAGASDELIKKFTKTVPGSRRFVVPRAWKKEECNE